MANMRLRVGDEVYVANYGHGMVMRVHEEKGWEYPYFVVVEGLAEMWMSAEEIAIGRAIPPPLDPLAIDMIEEYRRGVP